MFFQMDNYVKYNKNHHLHAFLSFLIVRNTFKEVQLRILVVGYTHQDINGNFIYLSIDWKNRIIMFWLTWWKHLWFHKIVLSFPNLSNKFHIQNLSQKMFEGWATNLSWAYGHAFIHLFMDLIGWPMMQYKLPPIECYGISNSIMACKWLRSIESIYWTSKFYSFSPYTGEWCIWVNWERKY
jgi:hypothetical protein